MTGQSGQHFWERSAWIWHVIYATGLAGAVVGTLASDGRDAARTAAVLAVLAVYLGWYTATGAVALHRDAPRRGHVYLLGLVPILTALIALDRDMVYLLFFTLPQVYILVDNLVAASLGVMALYVAYGGLLLAGNAELRAEYDVLLGQLGVSMAFSLLFGAWIGGIIRQSQRRAALIDELERTRAALAAERHEAGVLTERARLAAEIHDTLAQGFTSILMLSQAAGTAAGPDPATCREQLALIGRTARENLAEARSLIAALAPSGLQGATLPEALVRLADRHRQETGTEVRVDVRGDPVGAPDTDVVLLRAAQEALTNVRRHADADHVDVSLCYGPDGTTLTVADDGRGCDPAAPGNPATGYGLRGMRYRVEESGGTMSVTSTPGAGTTIRVALP